VCTTVVRRQVQFERQRSYYSSLTPASKYRHNKTESPYKVVARNEGVGWKLQVVDNNCYSTFSITTAPSRCYNTRAGKGQKMRSQGITPSQILNSLRCDK
jgi:hypothetical protein